MMTELTLHVFVLSIDVSSLIIVEYGGGRRKENNFILIFIHSQTSMIYSK